MLVGEHLGMSIYEVADLSYGEIKLWVERIAEQRKADGGLPR